MKPRSPTPYTSPTPSQIALQDALHNPAPWDSVQVDVRDTDVADRVQLIMGTRGCVPANVKPATPRPLIDDAHVVLPAHSPSIRHRRRERAMSLAQQQPPAVPRAPNNQHGGWFNQLFIKVMTFLFGRAAH